MSLSGRAALWVTKAPGVGKQSIRLSAVKLHAAEPEISAVLFHVLFALSQENPAPTLPTMQLNHWVT